MSKDIDFSDKEEYINPTFYVLTREGLILLIVSFVFLLLGLSYENMLYLIHGLIFPIIFIIFSIYLMRLDNYDIRVRIEITSGEIKAKTFLPVHIIVDSDRNFSGSIKLEVSDGLFPVITPLVSLIDSREAKGTTFLLLAPKRGKEKINRVVIQIAGFSGLFHLEQRIVLNKEIMVVPEPQRVALPWTMKQKILEDLVSEISVPVKGRGYDFFALRDFNFGDEVRHIHWRASAKYNKLIVKEFEEPMMLRFILVVDSSLLMNGPKLEFALSAAVEISTVIQRSHHSLSVIIQGDKYTKMIHLGQSSSALRTLALDLHNIRPEGTAMNYINLKNFIMDRRLNSSVLLILSDTENEPNHVKEGMMTLKRNMQAIFFFGLSTPGFGTLALSKVRDESFYNLDQLYYRREIVETSLERIYRRRFKLYQNLIDGPNSRFKVVKTYNTNILLELRELLVAFKGRKAHIRVAMRGEDNA